jgi:hypothetical protein
MLSGCSKNHLYVQQEWIDAQFLASSHVHTPDPRHEKPPTGQRLIISWRFPARYCTNPMSLKVTVRFWDNQEKRLIRPIRQPKGWDTFFFPSDLGGETSKILTYKVEVVDEKGAVIDTWYHHFWTEVIDVDLRH